MESPLSNLRITSKEDMVVVRRTLTEGLVITLIEPSIFLTAWPRMLVENIEWVNIRKCRHTRKLILWKTSLQIKQCIQRRNYQWILISIGSLNFTQWSKKKGGFDLRANHLWSKTHDALAAWAANISNKETPKRTNGLILIIATYKDVSFQWNRSLVAQYIKTDESMSHVDMYSVAMCQLLLVFGGTCWKWHSGFRRFVPALVALDNQSYESTNSSTNGVWNLAEVERKTAYYHVADILITNQSR